MTENKLRIGIIGMGQYAASQHVPNLRATGRAEIVAASRRNPERLALAQRELGIPEVYTDWREMLARTELDAVVVTTPHNLHLEPTLAALDRGLHVLLEKPLATSVKDAQAIVRAVHQSDRVVTMGVNRRGEPSWQAAQRVVASGQIGQVRQISAVMCADLRLFRQHVPMAAPLLQRIESSSEMNRAFTLDLVDPGSWRVDPLQVGGNMFADIGSHLVDVMLWMAGAPAMEVLAYAPKSRPAQAGILTLQALAGGVILSLTFNDNVALGDDFSFRGSGRLTVYGDNGTLTVDILGFGSGPSGEIWLERNGVRQAVAVEGTRTSPAAAFVASILDGAPNIATVDDAANVVALIQGAFRSVAEGHIVSLKDDA